VRGAAIYWTAWCRDIENLNCNSVARGSVYLNDFRSSSRVPRRLDSIASAFTVVVYLKIKPVVNLRVLSLNSVIGFRDSTLPARLSDENFPLKII
jgi:hypothetical protein